MTPNQNVLIVDLEATCWKRKPPEGEISEIIEIGICQLGISSYSLSNAHSILVRPTRSKVSAFCTKLTTLTQEQVDAGISFSVACDRLKRDFQSESSLWISWGAYDERMFREQCALFDVAYPFSPRHLNLKAFFAERFNDGHRVGMLRAMKMLGLVLEGTHHRGVDDAWNTGRILVTMLEKAGNGLLELEPPTAEEVGND